VCIAVGSLVIIGATFSSMLMPTSAKGEQGK
jgi:hypothetical protein